MDKDRQKKQQKQSRMLREECVEIWRRRVRARFPDLSLAEIHRSLEKSDCSPDRRAQYCEWIEKALSIADGDDELIRNAFEKRPKELRHDFARLIVERSKSRLKELRKFEGELLRESSLAREIKRVLKEFKKLHEEDRLFSTEFLGLALSGGGIRSASFNLGVLQSLSHRGVLRNVDYLSTVSGGGYIGASLTFQTAQDAGGFPFKPAIKGAEDPRISWIRAHGSYLNSGREVNTLTLAASILRGTFINLLFTAPLAFFVLWLLAQSPRLGFPPDEAHFAYQRLSYFSALRHPLAIALLLLAGTLILFLFRQAKGRKTPTKFQLSKPRVTFLWAAILVLLWLLEDVLRDDWILVAFAAFILPPVLLATRSLLRLWRNPPSWSTERLPLWIPETLAWLGVGGLLYLALQPLESRMLACYPFAHVCLMLVGAALFAKLIVNYFFMALMSGGAKRFNPVEQRYFSIQYGDLLGLSLVLGLLGALPVINDIIRSFWLDNSEELLGGLTVTGLISTALGWLRRSPGKELRGHVAFLLRGGVALLIGALLVLLHKLAQMTPLPDGSLGWLVVAILVIAWVLGTMSTDLNYISMHRYYRNRLADAFFGDPASEDFEEATKEVASSAGLRLKLKPEAAAYLASRIGGNRERFEKIIRKLAERHQNKPVEIDIAEAEGILPGVRCRGFHDSLQHLPLRDIRIGRSGSPYHLICATLVLAGSRTEKYRLRRGDSFIFSPRYLGSEATGWASIEDPLHKKMDLGTAMAISGAAVDPNTGVTSSLPLRIVMTLLNVRLGFWCAGPRGRKVSLWKRLWHESWTVLVVREMFALMHERSYLVRLSDGGHFENLGLYELVRRRCGQIIVCDATTDPDCHFSDLAQAIERIRIDFGVEVELNTKMLTPPKKTPCFSAPFVRGLIRYPPGWNALGQEEKEKVGEILFVKSTLFMGLPEDIRGYARGHESFPDESATDQFFDEDQFEAYRELGYRTGRHIEKDSGWY